MKGSVLIVSLPNLQQHSLGMCICMLRFIFLPCRGHDCFIRVVSPVPHHSARHRLLPFQSFQMSE